MTASVPTVPSGRARHRTIIGIVAAAFVLAAGAVAWVVVAGGSQATFAEAIQGDWNCTFTKLDKDGDRHIPGNLRVRGDGTFVLAASAPSEEASGRWSIRDGVLSIDFNGIQTLVDVPETLPPTLTGPAREPDGNELGPFELTVTDGGDHFRLLLPQGHFDVIECQR